MDIGVARDLSGEGLVVHKLGYGTGNIARGPAMTREQALDALSFGISLVGELKQKGYRIIATGEMGIGNTTTSSAVTAAPPRPSGRGGDGARRGTHERGARP